MSSTTISEARSRALSLRLDAEAVAVGVTALAFGLLALRTWATWGDLGRDTGYDFVAATRVAHGQMPYVDFVYYYGPLAPFALGLAVVLGGAGTSTFLTVGLMLTAAIVAATYALARTQTGPLGAAIAATATSAIALSPSNLSYVVPHTYSATFAILCALVFLLALSRTASGRTGAGWVAGTAAGLVALTRPEFEVAVVAAAVVWLLARARTGHAIRRNVLAIGAPAIAIPLVVYGSFMSAVSPHRLVFENLYPSQTLRAGGNAIVKTQAPLTPHSLLLVAGYLLLYAVGATGMVVTARLAARWGNAVVIALSVAVGSLILAAAAIDPEAARSRLEWVFGGLPLAAAIGACVLIVRHVVRRRAISDRDLTLLATLTVLTIVAAKNYSSFFFLATIAQPAVYSAPFIFVCLTRLHLVELARTRPQFIAGAAWLATLAVVCIGLTVKDGDARSATINGPGGSLRVSPAEAPLYRSALGAIESGSKPGDPILIAPQLTALYTLSKRTDPLREISLVPGALATKGSEKAAIATLEHDRVRLVLADRHVFTEYGQTRFGRSFDRGLYDWITKHYRRVATLRPLAGVSHTLDVWVRRAS